MTERAKLVRLRLVNIGPVGPDGLTVELDNIVCLVGPNNVGKSTVLRAYELAVNPTSFSVERDLCRWSSARKSSVELWVHIPLDTQNIGERWKEEQAGLLLVRSRWEWSEDSNWKHKRQTWDPEAKEYAEDGKAGGLDAVFSSRLPRPLRVGTLDGPDAEHKELNKLILAPAAESIRAALAQVDSPLSRAMAEFKREAQSHLTHINEHVQSLRDEINRSHNQIFPGLCLDFDIGLGDLGLDPMKVLQDNSFIKVLEGEQEIDWSRQGTGSQRALFWSLLRVRSRLTALASITQQNKKKVEELKKQAQKARADADKANSEDKRLEKLQAAQEFDAQATERANTSPETLLNTMHGDVNLPSYMLLMDEPEVALHPNAVRAASEYLYELAEDNAWQVMLTTHSPLFIDPMKDHTTIVRLDRSGSELTPRTFRTDTLRFSLDERENLKCLNRFDPGLAEMFFGPLPVIVEGDTEFAAFDYIMRLQPDVFPVHSRPVFVRARGKDSMVLVIRMLAHFKIPFAVLHDSDCPKRRDGRASSAWSANFRIQQAVDEARSLGVRVVHRISTPTFELAHQVPEIAPDGSLVDSLSDDKPWRMLRKIMSDAAVGVSVSEQLRELVDPTTREAPFDEVVGVSLDTSVKQWVDTHGVKDLRFMPTT